MKVLFAVSNEKISENIIKRYQKEYKEILSFKNVYYFDAILKEIQKDKSYDRIVISEDLEPFSNNNYDAIDKFIFDKLDNISDEAQDIDGNDTAIILICSDRRTKGTSFLVKIFGIGIYNALLGTERSMEQVCKLINKPRVKKEAKMYYKIDSDDVNYTKESDKEVSELEIQNINTHFKKLGKNTDKFAESFDNIASQYTDDQLRIIVNCLPINVKAVLEEDSSKYQELMSVSGTIQKVNRDSLKTRNAQKNAGIKIDIIESKMNENKMSGPIVIPASVRTSKNKTPQPVKPVGNKLEVPNVADKSKKTKKVINKKTELEEAKNTKTTQPSVKEKKEALNKKRTEKTVNESDIIEKKVVMPDGRVVVKKVRKKKTEEKTPKITKASIPPVIENKNKLNKKKTKKDEDEFILPMEDEFESLDKTFKVPEVNSDFEEETLLGMNEDFGEETLPGMEEDFEEETLPGMDDDFADDALLGMDDDFEEETLSGMEDDLEEEPILGMDDDFEEEALPGIDEDFEEETLPGMEDDFEEEYTDEVNLPDLDDLDDIETQTIPGVDDDFENDIENSNFANEDISSSTEIDSIKPKVDYSMSNLNSLLTKDKKIVTFLGTTKNGTSFLVNNLAILFSSLGINTAILDMTQNRNSYYIYTNNQEELRNIAYNSISKLSNGFNEGIRVNKNLTVFTALPNDGKDYSDAETILSTLVQNYSLILIDCDFDTPPAYFASCQEIYLVQSMDILTIQPLTAFLRDLKNIGVLEPEKVRVVVNKEIKVKSLSEKAIIGGMSFYNDPSMSYMNELFNKDMVKACTIPFEDSVYAKYLDSMATCSISLNGYSKSFISKLKTLGNMVYPLVSKSTYGNGKTPVQSNNFASKGFSKNIDNTLNQMRKKH